MFKKIDIVFEKRKTSLVKAQSKESKVKEYLKVFLEKEFGEDLEKRFSFLININSKDNILTITAENKMLANELAVRLVKLNDFLKTKEVSLNKILIR